jgi:uncharacterized membrane-anchored protein
MRKTLLLLTLFASSLFGYANDEDSLKILKEKIAFITDSVNKSMKWERGTISIADGSIKLNIPQGFKFLNAEQSQHVLEDLWGNLKDSSVLGMIFPESASPLSDSAWAYVVTYNQMGYVKDTDADDINYEDLLKEMKEDSKKTNEERVKQGLDKFDLIGWAQKPYYDKENKVLHWAKEFHAEGAEGNTLNYDIRILGRKGVLSMNAVAGMEQLPEVKSHINEVLKMAEFTDGNKYDDFNPDVDEVAAWTIGGLVAGKVLAKAGFLAIILKYLKLIILGVAALGGGIWKWVTGRRKKQEALVSTAGEQDGGIA